MLVGGDRVAGGRGAYAVVNPATEQEVGRAPEASVDQVAASAAAAAKAFPAWSRTRPDERAALLARLADVLATQSPELVPLVQAETGATQRVARTMQVPQTIARFRLLDDREFAEYYLLGTLGSVGVAILTGYLARAALAA